MEKYGLSLAVLELFSWLQKRFCSLVRPDMITNTALEATALLSSKILAYVRNMKKFNTVWKLSAHWKLLHLGWQLRWLLDQTNKQAPTTPLRCRGTPTDDSAAVVTNVFLFSPMCSKDDNDWPVHFLMLSLHDLHGVTLQWQAVWFLAAHHNNGRHGRTTSSFKMLHICNT